MPTRPRKRQNPVAAPASLQTGGEDRSWEPLPNLATRAEIGDPVTGVIWRRRGGRVAERRLRGMLADPGVRVLHDYLGEVHEVAPAQREAFFVELRARMDGSTHADFYAAEFKNGDLDYLLVVHEDC